MSLLNLSDLDDLTTLQGRVRIASALALDVPNVRWDVDLTAPKFTFREGSEVLFEGPCQLIGTHVEGDGFLWGFENESIHETGWRSLKTKLDGLPEVAEAVRRRKSAIEVDAARRACEWIAAHTGFTGCFTGTVGAATSLLAVQLTGADASEPGASGWCGFCGALRRQRKTFIAGPDHLFLCDSCASTFEAIIEESPASGALPVDGPAALRFCLFCLEPRGGLVLGAHGGLCRECIGLVGEILKQHR